MQVRHWTIGLNLVSATAALGAALFWFLSAAPTIPPMLAYWGTTPAADPFFRALVTAANLNRIAASLSGVAAAALAMAQLLQARSQLSR